jgi:AcrR family transcriptional regulator/DNA-binding MarR family transcriptional regulator
MVGNSSASSNQAVPGDLSPAGNGLGHQQVQAIQRARMIAAMAEVYAELGAPDVTVAHVVARSGVSRRTFYEVFEDLEDCFLAAFDDGVERASRYVLDTVDPNMKWVDRVRASLTALLSFLDDEPLMGRLRILTRILTVIDQGRGEARAGQGAPPLTAEGMVGGALSILHARLLQDNKSGLVELTGPLMGMIVLPYLGAAASRRELERPPPKPRARRQTAHRNPLHQLETRLTYRTVRVLMTIASHPGSSNRKIADASGIADQGQMSKLLARLHQLDLIQNTGAGAARGEPNAWTLTDKGWQIHNAIAQQTTHTYALGDRRQ